jgi:hypothetical protein
MRSAVEPAIQSQMPVQSSRQTAEDAPIPPPGQDAGETADNPAPPPAPVPPVHAVEGPERLAPSPEPVPAPATRVEPQVVNLPEEPPAGRGPQPGSPTVVPALPAPAPPAAPREEQQPPRPAINVTIGRVEVRAVFAPPPQPAPRPQPAPAMSLEEYLKQRDGGRS